MSANLSQRQAPRVRQVTKQWAAELGPAVKPRDTAFREVKQLRVGHYRLVEHPVTVVVIMDQPAGHAADAVFSV